MMISLISLEFNLCTTTISLFKLKPDVSGFINQRLRDINNFIIIIDIDVVIFCQSEREICYQLIQLCLIFRFLYITNIEEQNFISSISRSLHRLSIPCYSRLLIHHPSLSHFSPHCHPSRFDFRVAKPCIAERVHVICVGGMPSTFLKTQDKCTHSHLFKLHYMSIFYTRLILYHTSICYGPTNLFDLRLGQAQLNLTKNSQLILVGMSMAQQIVRSVIIHGHVFQ